MVAVLSIMIFAGAALVATWTIAAMIAPQWRRIVSLATGHTERRFSPLTRLVHAERRIAVRRWAGQSPATTPVSTRAAA